MKTILKELWTVAFLSLCLATDESEMRQLFADTARINTYDQIIKFGV